MHRTISPDGTTFAFPGRSVRQIGIVEKLQGFVTVLLHEVIRLLPRLPRLPVPVQRLGQPLDLVLSRFLLFFLCHRLFPPLGVQLLGRVLLHEVHELVDRHVAATVDVYRPP